LNAKLKNEFKVGEYVVNRDLNSIFLQGHTQIVEPKIIEVLYYLASNADQVVSRQQLMDELWPAKVSDGAVSRVVGLLRKALKDSSESPEYIQTIAKKGYRLIAPVTTIDSNVEADLLQKFEYIAKGANDLAAPLTEKHPIKAVLMCLLLMVIIGLVVQSISGDPVVKNLNIQQAKFSQQTSEPGFERDATLSVDQSWLAYRHSKNANDPYHLYLKILASQKVIQLTDTKMNDRVPAFSANKQRLAFFSKGLNQCHLNILNLDENGNPLETKTLYKCGAVEHYSNLAWSKDNKSLFFTDRVSNDLPYQIYQLNIATGKLDEITRRQDNYYGDNELALSPSGKQLIFFRNKFWGNNQVFVKNLITGEQRKIAELGFLSWNPSWTPDEKSILFSDNRAGGALKLLDISTGEITTLYSSIQKINSPELSDDGSKITYSIETAEVDIWQQAISSNSNPLATKLAINSSRFDSQPVYSKSSNALLFLSDRNGTMQLWLQKEKQLIAFDLFSQDIAIDMYAWHPDGKYFVVATSDKNMYLVDSSSQKLQKIDLGGQVAAFPSFSIDGTKLYFSSDKSGDWQIWSVNFNEKTFSKQKKITLNGGYQAKSSQIDDMIYYTKYRQKGIWQLNLADLNERKLVDGVHRSDNFNVCSNSILFLKSQKQTQLWQYDFDSTEYKQILLADNNARLKFDVIDNCQNVVFSKWQNLESDVMMMSLPPSQ